MRAKRAFCDLPKMRPTPRAHGGGHKSQISAPVELLIAVVVMAMSLAIAYYLWGEIDCARCLAEQKGEGQKLADALHAVSLGFAGTKQSASYTMRSCCGAKVDGVRFSRYSSREFCGKCLGSFGKGCWKVEPVGYDRDGFLVPFSDADVCVDMSESLDIFPCAGSTAFTDSPCPEQDGADVSSSECAKKVYLQKCSSGEWWTYPGESCPGNTGIARFKTLQRTSGSFSYDINISKESAVDALGMKICAAPRG